MVATLVAAWLLLSAAAYAQREQDFYDFKAVNIRGKLVSLEKYRGSVSVRPRQPRPLPGWAWVLEPRDPGPRGCGSEEAPRLCPGSHHPRHSPRGAAPPDPALGLSRDDVARPRHTVKPETLPADEDFPPSERLWALESGPLPEADRLGPAFVMHGSESNPSILPPLSLPPPVSASGAGIVAALESNESTVKMNAQCIGGYLFRSPFRGDTGASRGKVICTGSHSSRKYRAWRRITHPSVDFSRQTPKMAAAAGLHITQANCYLLSSERTQREMCLGESWKQR